ncbi:hypothetical protein QMN21_26965 [Serratia sp. Se-PFBMAAmG]|nr:hypothetical protein [Serratia sp. Se-PFBMAAmG]
MALAHHLGFPHDGYDRELNKAQEAFCKGELDEAGLRAIGRDRRASHWQLQMVPEFTEDQDFALSWEQLFEEVEEAKALGHALKPVVIGPLTYLWLGKAKGGDFDKLDLVDRLLPLYDQVFNRLAAQGVEWVQIDEPILVLDLPQEWKNAYERVYNILQRAPLKKLIATYFGSLEENLGLAANLPVDGLHIDQVRAPEQYLTILDRLPAYKILSLGLGNGSDISAGAQEKALQHVAERLGERLWVAAA